MKKDRHPYRRFLIDTELLNGANVGRPLDRLARAKPDRRAYRKSRQRLTAEMGRAPRPAFAPRTVWVLAYAASVAAAAVFAYARGVDRGLETAQLANPLPIIARAAPADADPREPREPRRRRSRLPVRVKPAPTEPPATSSDELAEAAMDELPVVEQSAEAYEALATSVSDPERKVEALSRAADIYGTVLDDGDRAVSTYRHQVAICQRALSGDDSPGGRRPADELQRERLRLHLEKARLEIALAAQRAAPSPLAPLNRL